MAQEGGCMCGNVRYSVEGEPAMKALCHCKDCQKITGSTYSTNGVYPEGNFKVLKGTTKEHSKVADGGNKITSHFCGDCGSTMWRQGPSFPGMRIVKVGTLDGTGALESFQPGAELYAPQRTSWVTQVDGAQQNKGMS